MLRPLVFLVLGEDGRTVPLSFPCLRPLVFPCLLCCSGRRQENRPLVLNCRRSTDKSYPGDNRLISPKSPYRRGGLAPRCRLIASWSWSRFQGLGCSPIKAVRELGSERRETVRSLSVAGAGNLKGAVLSTRGPGWTYHWCTSCHANGTAG